MRYALDEGAFAPTRAYPTDAGLDLRARESMIIPARESAVFDTGVHIELPYNTAGLIMPRSGMNVRHGLICQGVIDCSYTGSMVVKLYNLSGYDYEVKAGDKIAQLVVDKIEARGRGNNGFGSSGR